MSEFRGFRCDGCQKIIEDPEERVKERTRFEGNAGTEDFFRDLCPQCADSAVEEATVTKRAVPRRRRRTRSTTPIDLGDGTVQDADEQRAVA